VDSTEQRPPKTTIPNSQSPVSEENFSPLDIFRMRKVKYSNPVKSGVTSSVSPEELEAALGLISKSSV